MHIKPFDPKLKIWDPVAKKNSIQIMDQFMGMKFVRENKKEDVGDFSSGKWDLEFTDNNGVILIVEAECKGQQWFGFRFLNWWNPLPFQYEDIDIPFRKSNNNAQIFIVVSTCEKFAFIISKKKVKEHFESHGSIVKPNECEPDGGEFLRTPTVFGKFLIKIDERWYQWKKKYYLRYLHYRSRLQKSTPSV